ncbi:cupin-like domain-containing protein [Nocardia sp. NPDC052316]|uniref:cupin-like domain-containing protein n=1 Tax=Nocardia sp. NPDC052316 TaxID=3364329 RepID=UPI0037CBE4BB
MITSTPPTRQEFVDRHLAVARPLVVRQGLNTWRIAPPWNFDTLVARVGDQRVPLYGSLFDFIGLSTFRNYHDRFLTSAAPTAQPAYLRWYTRQSEARLPWADSAFDALADFWHAPQWLPADGFVFPAYGGRTDVVRQSFPAKGIFVCGRGGMTRWHVDPWRSDAYLCQVIGHKRILLYRPGTAAPRDPEALGSVIDTPDALPPGWPAEPLIDVVLAPGDCIYIPQDHPHAAVALSPSLSLTWNFVHRANDAGYRALVASDADDATLRYFSAPVAQMDVA